MQDYVTVTITDSEGYVLEVYSVEVRKFEKPQEVADLLREIHGNILAQREVR